MSDLALKIWRKANGKYIINSSGKLIRCTHCPCESSSSSSLVCSKDLLTFSKTMVIKHQSAYALYDKNTGEIIGYEFTNYEIIENKYRLIENSVSAYRDSSGSCVISVRYQLDTTTEDAGVTLSFSSSAEFLGASYFGDLGYYDKLPVIPADKYNPAEIGSLASIHNYLSTIKSGRPTPK